MTIIVYGIPNCDTVRKARKWLEQQAIDYHFHDVRADPVTSSTIETWLAALGVDALLNKRSTAWRTLNADQQDLSSTAKVVALLQQHPTLMKRPLLDINGQYTTGFQAETWQQLIRGK